MPARWLLSLLLAASPASADWLKIVKSQDGFLFSGGETGEPFTFDVPGKDIRTAEDGNRAFAEIDGVVVQLFLAATAEPGKSSGLAGYAASEKDYLTSAGATIAESSACSPLAVAHQEWSAAVAGNVSYYLVVNAGKHLLVVVTAAPAADTSPSPALKTLASVCSSLSVG